MTNLAGVVLLGAGAIAALWAASRLAAGRWRELSQRAGHPGVDAGILSGAALGVLGGAVAALVALAVGTGFGLGALMVVLVAAVGALAPSAVAQRREAARLREIDRQAAVAAGLLSVTVRAGLGLDAALEAVAEEMDGPLGEELAVAVNQTRLGAGRQEALDDLAKRAPAANVVRLSGSLAHAERLGAPLATTLDSLAADCRARAAQAAREDAAKLPVKILFPIVLLVFPPMLAVLIGPALVDIAEALR